MGNTSSDRELLRFFLRRGLTQGLLLWLSFRGFLSNPGWQKELATGSEQSTENTLDLLARWAEKAPKTHSMSLFTWLFNGAGAVLGAVSMSVALSYSGDTPVNLWVLLALFAFLPLFLTAITAYSVFFRLRFGSVMSSPLITHYINRSGLTQSIHEFPKTVVPWGVWKFQFFSLLLLVSALITFLVMATFQDFTFGWSSTLIQSDQTMVTLIRYITWPWHWLMTVPTDGLIVSSRFYRGMPMQDAQLLGQWWPTVVSAIVVYGILPRFLLLLLLRHRFVRALKQDILESGELERFVNAFHRIRSTGAVDIASLKSVNQPLELIRLEPQAFDAIGWQLTNPTYPLVRNLGLASWAEDELWLQACAENLQKPAIILVNLQQTPTGELADCIEIIQHGSQGVSLGLLNGADITDREKGLLKSWQYFAQQHDLTLYQIDGTQHD